MSLRSCIGGSTRQAEEALQRSTFQLVRRQSQHLPGPMRFARHGRFACRDRSNFHSPSHGRTLCCSLTGTFPVSHRKGSALLIYSTLQSILYKLYIMLWLIGDILVSRTAWFRLHNMAYQHVLSGLRPSRLCCKLIHNPAFVSRLKKVLANASLLRSRSVRQLVPLQRFFLQHGTPISITHG